LARLVRHVANDRGDIVAQRAELNVEEMHVSLDELDPADVVEIAR